MIKDQDLKIVESRKEISDDEESIGIGMPFPVYITSLHAYSIPLPVGSFLNVHSQAIAMADVLILPNFYWKNPKPKKQKEPEWSEIKHKIEPEWSGRLRWKGFVFHRCASRASSKT